MSVILNRKKYNVKEKKGLRFLTLSSKYIKDISKIEGLESLTDLHVLNLVNCNISEIEGLETLTNLEELRLGRNNIKEIKGLDNLSKLRMLYLNSNEIKEIEGLDNLTKLATLNLADNNITHVESFSNKDDLQTLSLNRNPICSQLRYISGKTTAGKFKKYVQMSNREREEAEEEFLVKNDLVSYEGRDFKVKKTFEGYLTLDLNSKGIKDISEIKGLKNQIKLKTLDLNQNQISEIKGLETLVNLRELELQNNPIETIKGLDNLVNLFRLNLYSCKIHQIESFKIKKSLNYFYLGKNPLYHKMKYAHSKIRRKKLGLMTESERISAGVSPSVWEAVKDARYKLWTKPVKKNSAFTGMW